MKAEPGEKGDRGGIARVGFRRDLRGVMRGKQMRDQGGERLTGQTLAPVVGVQDIAKLQTLPGPGLADHAPFVFDHEVIAMLGNHRLQEVARLVAAVMFGGGPIAHCQGMRQNGMQGVKVLLAGAAQDKAGGEQPHCGVSVVIPTAPARASSGSSDIGVYSPRRHNSPRSS